MMRCSDEWELHKYSLEQEYGTTALLWLAYASDKTRFELESRPFCLEDWALCYGGGSLSAEICGYSSLSKDEEWDDIGASSEEVESKFVFAESPKVESESAAEDGPSH
ncbi:hypothetical protein RIF29_26366 [Crotalaria pallida]|uniref:Uncharacterized protein n=1 Tax=Crotalaria pallida TaxID=3830 RepID=A0AAN9ENJ6_CROPI